MRKVEAGQNILADVAAGRLFDANQIGLARLNIISCPKLLPRGERGIH